VKIQWIEVVTSQIQGKETKREKVISTQLLDEATMRKLLTFTQVMVESDDYFSSMQITNYIWKSPWRKLLLNFKFFRNTCTQNRRASKLQPSSKWSHTTTSCDFVNWKCSTKDPAVACINFTKSHRSVAVNSINIILLIMEKKSYEKQEWLKYNVGHFLNILYPTMLISYSQQISLHFSVHN
jgi:hypothetical protein